MTNGIPDTKEEFDQIVNPDEYERRIALVKRGIESAKHRSDRTKKLIELRQKRYRRKEVTSEYGI